MKLCKVRLDAYLHSEAHRCPNCLTGSLPRLLRTLQNPDRLWAHDGVHRMRCRMGRPRGCGLVLIVAVHNGKVIGLRSEEES